MAFSSTTEVVDFQHIDQIPPTGTSESVQDHASRRDSSDPVDSLEIPPRVNPFGTPNASAPTSRAGSTTGFQSRAEEATTYFTSRRMHKGTAPKPWLEKKDSRQRWVTVLPILGIVLSLATAAVFIWFGLQTVVQHDYCPVYLQDGFGQGLDSSVWTKEVEVGGFG